MTKKFDIVEYVDLFYNPKRRDERLSMMADSAWGRRLFAKADQLTDTDADIRVRTFGAPVFNWLNYNSELWSLLPKKPVGPNTGYRVLAGPPIGTGATGMQQTVEISAGQTIASFVNIQWTMKWMDVAFGSSERVLFESEHDDAVDIWATLRDHFGKLHVKGLDNALARNVNTVTQATFQIESIDRMISSSSEATFLVSSGGLTGATAADVYPYGQDLRRQGFSGAGAGNAPFDAVVLANSGVIRAFDLGLLDEAIRTVEKNGATREGLVIVTGYDTADVISQRLEARQRFMATTRIQNTLNGVQRVSDTAVGAGVDVMSYKGIPIFRSRAVDNNKALGGLASPAGGLSVIYGITLADCYIAVGMPTVYLETGRDDWLLLDRLRRKAAYFTAAELIFTRFNTHFKIRDISA